MFSDIHAIYTACVPEQTTNTIWLVSICDIGETVALLMGHELVDDFERGIHDALADLHRRYPEADQILMLTDNFPMEVKLARYPSYVTKTVIQTLTLEKHLEASMYPDFAHPGLYLAEFAAICGKRWFWTCRKRQHRPVQARIQMKQIRETIYKYN